MPYEAPAGTIRDKDSDLFGRPHPEPCNDLFDKYLDFEAIDSPPTSHIPDHHEPTQMVSFMKRPQSANTLGGLPYKYTRHINLHQPSQDDEWPLPNTSSQIHQTYTDPKYILYFNEEIGRATVSDNEHLNLDGIDLHTPHLPHYSPSPSLSPTPAVSQKRVQKPYRFFDSITKTVRKAIKGSATEDQQRSPQRSPIRKAKSTTMMRASQYSHGNPDWTQRLTLDASKFNDHKFDFLPQHQGPLSPPPSARVSDSSDCSHQMLAMQEHHSHQGFHYEPPMPQFATRGGDYHTPLLTPSLENDSSRRGSLVHHASLDNLPYPTTPHTGVSSQAPWAHAPNNEFDSFRPGPFDPDSESNPLWWNGSQAPIAQPSPSIYHNDPRQTNKTLAMQLQSELAYNASELACSPSSLGPGGLMIQMPHSPVHQSYIVESPIQGGGYFTTSHAAQPPSYTHQHRPRLHKSRSVISSSSSPSPKQSISSTFPSLKNRRASSRKANDLAPRTPISGNGLGGGVDFVNFTPSDSMKILTGVAPSGSSKTKARREKEAMEKRRRLSLAAVRAVRAAGGDVESLVEEGLFVGVGV